MSMTNDHRRDKISSWWLNMFVEVINWLKWWLLPTWSILTKFMDLPQWKFFIMVNFSSEGDSLTKWWIVIVVMNHHDIVEFHFIDIFSLQWWIFITVVNFHKCDKFSSVWWIVIWVMMFHLCDQFSSQWWIYD